MPHTNTALISPSGVKRIFGLTIGAILIAALVVGCGGSKKSSTTSTDTPAAAPAATSGSGSQSGSNNGSSSAPAVTATAASSDSSGGATASPLSSLTSYKYALNISGNGGALSELASTLGSGDSSGDVSMAVTGAYVAPDKAQTDLNISGLDITRTVIGDQQWQDVGGLVQGPQPATPSDVQDVIFINAFWSDSDFTTTLNQFNCSSSTETVNGVETHMCGIDKETYNTLRSTLGGFFGNSADITDLTTFNFQVWLTSDGVPVRMRVEMIGTDADNAPFNLKMNLDITDINSNFDITPPSN